MCLRTKKLFFAAGCAALSFILHSSTGTENVKTLNSILVIFQDISIINTKGNTIFNKVILNKPFNQLTIKDYVIDKTNGDLYYKNSDAKWVLSGNIGLYNHEIGKELVKKGIKTRFNPKNAAFHQKIWYSLH